MVIQEGVDSLRLPSSELGYLSCEKRLNDCDACQGLAAGYKYSSTAAGKVLY